MGGSAALYRLAFLIFAFATRRGFFQNVFHFWNTSSYIISLTTSILFFLFLFFFSLLVFFHLLVLFSILFEGFRFIL